MKPEPTDVPPGTDPYVDCFRDNVVELIERAKNGEDLKTAAKTAHTQLDRTFDENVAKSGHKIACQAGCFYCCHSKVDVYPVEAFIIADYIRKNFSVGERGRLESVARENIAKVAPLTYEQQMLAMLPCPLLREKKCSVYPVRPSLCRIMHSTRVDLCKSDFENPRADAKVEWIALVRARTGSAAIGIRDAYRQMGYDGLAYDINSAVLTALSSPKPEKRWRDKKTAFPQDALAKDVIERRRAEKEGTAVPE